MSSITHRFIAALVLCLVTFSPASTQNQPFDVIISGGQVLDGTGSPATRADVGVRGDRIVAVGQLSGQNARRTASINLSSRRGADSVRGAQVTLPDQLVQ